MRFVGFVVCLLLLPAAGASGREAPVWGLERAGRDDPFGVVRLDPRTLTGTSRPVRLPRRGYAIGFESSPGGRRVAVSSADGNVRNWLTFLTRSGRRVGSVRLGGSYVKELSALAWLKPRRIVLTISDQSLKVASTQVVVVDPVARKVISRRTFKGIAQGGARTPGRLSVLVTRGKRLQLRVLGADGKQQQNLSLPDLPSKAFGSVAADPRSNRVYASVPGQSRIHEIDPVSGTLVSHRLPVVVDAFVGTPGPHAIPVDSAFKAAVVDPRTWTVSARIDDDHEETVRAGDGVARYDGDDGITGYDLDGRERWEQLVEQQLAEAVEVGRYVFVTDSGNDTWAIQSRTGRLLRSKPRVARVLTEHEGGGGGVLNDPVSDESLEG